MFINPSCKRDSCERLAATGSERCHRCQKDVERKRIKRSKKSSIELPGKDEQWTYPVWKSGDGNDRKPCDFNDQHLMNTIRFIESRASDGFEIPNDEDDSWNTFVTLDPMDVNRIYDHLVGEARRRKIAILKDEQKPLPAPAVMQQARPVVSGTLSEVDVAESFRKVLSSDMILHVTHTNETGMTFKAGIMAAERLILEIVNSCQCGKEGNTPLVECMICNRLRSVCEDLRKVTVQDAQSFEKNRSGNFASGIERRFEEIKNDVMDVARTLRYEHKHDSYFNLLSLCGMTQENIRAIVNSEMGANETKRLNMELRVSGLTQKLKDMTADRNVLESIVRHINEVSGRALTADDTGRGNSQVSDGKVGREHG